MRRHTTTDVPRERENRIKKEKRIRKQKERKRKQIKNKRSEGQRKKKYQEIIQEREYSSRLQKRGQGKKEAVSSMDSAYTFRENKYKQVDRSHQEQ